MPAALKPVLAREMEVYAAFLEHTDHHIGRLIDTLKDLEVLGDTLIYCIFGDNGASAEGTLNGCFNQVAVLNGMSTLETPEFLKSKIDGFGGPEAYNHYVDELIDKNRLQTAHALGQAHLRQRAIDQFDCIPKAPMDFRARAPSDADVPRLEHTEREHSCVEQVP